MLAKQVSAPGEPVIRPRVDKPKDVRQSRVKKRAEVFTPSWLCQRMIDDPDTSMLRASGSDTRMPFATAENREMFRHTFWLVPGVREALALQRLLEESWPGFKVVNVAGDGDPDDPAGEALAAVRAAIAASEWTITLSCGKLTTGVTVPEWSAVLMLAGRYESSAIRYLQTIFRVQSPGWLGGRAKENAYVYDFAPDRTLKVIADAARISACSRDGGGDALPRWASCSTSAPSSPSTEPRCAPTTPTASCATSSARSPPAPSFPASPTIPSTTMTRSARTTSTRAPSPSSGIDSAAPGWTPSPATWS